MLESSQESLEDPSQSERGIQSAKHEHTGQVDQGMLRYRAMKQPPLAIQGREFGASIQGTTPSPQLEPSRTVHSSGNMAEQQEKASWSKPYSSKSGFFAGNF